MMKSIMIRKDEGARVPQKDGRKRTFLEQATAETNPIRMRGCMVRNQHLSELALEWSNSHGTHDNEKNIFKQMDSTSRVWEGVGRSPYYFRTPTPEATYLTSE